MFLDLLQDLGTFFGGLGALVAATVQLLTFLKKDDEEMDGESHSDDAQRPWKIPVGAVACLTAAA